MVVLISGQWGDAGAGLPTSVLDQRGLGRSREAGPLKRAEQCTGSKRQTQLEGLCQLSTSNVGVLHAACLQSLLCPKHSHHHHHGVDLPPSTTSTSANSIARCSIASLVSCPRWTVSTPWPHSAQPPPVPFIPVLVIVSLKLDLDRDLDADLRLYPRTALKHPGQGGLSLPARFGH